MINSFFCRFHVSVLPSSPLERSEVLLFVAEAKHFVFFLLSAAGQVLRIVVAAPGSCGRDPESLFFSPVAADIVHFEGAALCSGSGEQQSLVAECVSVADEQLAGLDADRALWPSAERPLVHAELVRSGEAQER